MPRALKSDARNTILKVLAFMQEEKRLKAPLIPFEKLYERVAAAAGVGERFVRQLVKEKKQADATGSKISTPGKKRIRITGKIEIDDFDLGVIRRKVHEFYTIKKEIPTIPKLLNILRQEINFTASRETLRKVLRKIGFRYKKTQSNRKVLIERNDISAWRAGYLQKIKLNECGEKKPVIFLDETYIHSSHTVGRCWQSDNVDGALNPVSKGNRWIIVHAGGEMGFVENALLVFKSNTKSGDYHDEMNNTNFKKWVTEKLLPNLQTETIIVMDNAPYHSICINKCPNTNAKKADMQHWLNEHNVEYNESYTKPQLYELIKRHKPVPQYEIDNLLRDNGHTVLRLPPYHCDLNVIEMIWSSMKRFVAEHNIGKSDAEMPQLIAEAFTKITTAEWQKHCAHVKNIENEYLKKDAYLDEPFIISVGSDSESDSSDSDDELAADASTTTGIPRIQPPNYADDCLMDHNYYYKI
ncbi:uncharacterized protein LOC135118660 [Helicoverpa armigera]|uniref:uncharacterized protein LOC135118660 n=1 Tax=Helicoverpa armigera TaxID=29058 RepID=UPI0030827F12